MLILRKSKEQKEWLLFNFKYCAGNTKKLTDGFNLFFDTNITNSDVRQFLRFVGLLDRKNVTKEQIDFLLENRNTKSKKLSEMFYKKFGIIVSDTWIRRKLFALAASKEYCKYVYQKHIGEIPKGYTVIHLNSNYMDNDVSNLYLIPQRYVKLMKKNNWFFENKDMTMVAIKYLELFYKLKESEE